MATARESEVLTIAAIRTAGKQATEYLFNERASVFTMTEQVAADAASARLLKVAFDKKQPVKVAVDTRRQLIQRIGDPSKRELEELSRRPALLEKPAKPVAIDLAKIDPTNFNFVDIHQKWPGFKLCTKPIPSYAKAVEIFDFCAQLSCSLPGPYAVAPCIPFQYVRDGCYARAHQMRRIISTRYGYCCEKVFSFANQGVDRLAVRATKWGGCCVTWWYHVAPLVRVRISIKTKPAISLTLAMVIDPGMFDKPVLLSTWLAAQQDTTCHPTANLSMYSIQPGSAYWPANYAGTAFGTDPTYTQTEATLLAYSGLTTCP